MNSMSLLLVAFFDSKIMKFRGWKDQIILAPFI